MNKINYQKELEKTLENITKSDIKPSLLLHVCCAPCSSYVLEYLNKYFNITALFYNPNISTDEEYNHRAKELIRFINEKDFENPIKTVISDYIPQEFYDMAKGLEGCPEGGARCFKCYRLRLEQTAKMAKKEQFDYFTTTLSISPLKDSQKLNEIGQALEKNMELNIYIPILRRRTDISVPLNFPKNTICTDRISVVVNFQSQTIKF